MITTSSRPVRSTLHTLTKRVGERALGGLFHLPPATTGYTVSPVRVPMRDGIELQADHYAPSAATKPAGTLLVRGPYGRGFPYSVLWAGLYAARGYHVVVQSVRGTFGSAGVFEPGFNEAADGADTAAWLREQPWFTGRFGTIGMSYLGLTQWALLVDPPPELAAAVIPSGPHDFRAFTWDTGSFAVNDFLGWSDVVGHQEDQSGGHFARQVRTRRKLARAAGELPLGAGGRALLGACAPWYESWLEHPDRKDPFWDPQRLEAALDRVQVPVLLISGWQDLILGQTLAQYQHLRDRGVEVALTVGPWTHNRMLTKGMPTIARESLDWLDTHLGGVPRKSRPSRVRVFVTGEGWHELSDWPPSTTEQLLYLQPGGGLAPTPPPATAPPATFRYDPADPTPTVGGPMLFPADGYLIPGGGYRDDSRLAQRHDVLSFTGDVLTEDLCVHGNPVVELVHTSERPYVDVFVRVSEVDAKGRSRNVSDGYRRLRDAPKTVSVELDAIAHRFSAGSRIRVLVAGGCHPRYARNLGTDEPPLTGVRMKPATHAVHFGTSRLLLPTAAALSGGVADPAGDLA